MCCTWKILYKIHLMCCAIYPVNYFAEPCSIGKFYNEDIKACDSCPKGSYQHQIGQNVCFKCPGNSSTDYTGSTTIDDCKSKTHYFVKILKFILLKKITTI